MYGQFAKLVKYFKTAGSAHFLSAFLLLSAAIYSILMIKTLIYMFFCVEQYEIVREMWPNKSSWNHSHFQAAALPGYREVGWS